MTLDRIAGQHSLNKIGKFNYFLYNRSMDMTFGLFCQFIELIYCLNDDSKMIHFDVRSRSTIRYFQYRVDVIF